MPVSTRKQHYNSPQTFDRASVRPHTVVATEALGAFNVDGYPVLTATLRLHETVVTAMTGANNDITVTARNSGASPLTFVLADPAANNAALSVSKSGDVITVNLATGSGGAITSTASQVVAAINASSAVKGYAIAALAAGNSGAGIVTALASTAVAAWSGTTPTLDVVLETTYDNGATWTEIGAFAQKTAIGAAQGKAFVGLGTKARWKATVTGTTPVMAYSIKSQAVTR